MATGWSNPVVAGTVLTVAAIRSPNYVKGVSGWAINQDGTVDLNGATIRGAVLSESLTAGNTVIVNQDGVFMYDGPARAVNPPASGGGTGGATANSIPNTATASVSGGESGQVWTKVSDDGIGTAVFQGIA